MVTYEEVKAAEERMNQARAVLLGYVERPKSQPSDFQLHLRIAEDLKGATDDYVRLVGELSK
jgi:hypothetical protein